MQETKQLAIAIEFTLKHEGKMLVSTELKDHGLSLQERQSVRG